MSLDYQDPLEGQAFDEVNNLLDEGTSQTDILVFKIGELQKIVQTLTRTNQKLLTRIEELEDQLQAAGKPEDASFNEEYSQLQGGFGDVEEMLRDYKASLESYKRSMASQLSEKNGVIGDLERELQVVRKEGEEQRQQISQLQLENEMLQNTKEGLLSEIEELQSSIRKSKLQTPKYSNRFSDVADRYEGSSDFGGDFGLNVQNQLEKLIEKLVKELEHERHLKKKLMEEIKQLRKDVMDQEKEIMDKNNKIYQLEITAIKSHKAEGNRMSKVNRRVDTDDRRGGASRDYAIGLNNSGVVGGQSPSSRRKNFTLMQLMNECTVLSCKEKLIISLKLIDLFSKKYQNNDYSSEVLESLLVTNYHLNNAHLCQVKLNPTVEKEQQEEESEQTLVWNLMFVLDSLLTQMASRDRSIGESESEETLMEAIGFFLERREENSIDSVIELRKIVEEALSEHLR